MRHNISNIYLRSIFFILVFGILSENLCAETTLSQCFDWAKAQNEDLQSQQETIYQSEAKAKAALGQAYPNISWAWDTTWNDPSGVRELERQGFSGFVEKRQTEAKFKAEQPLFSGLREFSAFKGFKHEQQRNFLLMQRFSFQLYEHVARTFYSVLNHETHQANTKVAFDLAEGRVKELRDFLRLGKARESEVFTAQAYAAGLKAQLDQIDGEIQASRRELSFLTGKDLMATPLSDSLGIVSSPPSLEESLAKTQNRSDIRAASEDAETKKMRIRYEKGLFWPSADITGNYYTERATFLDKIDWDVALSVDFPLFQGGTVAAAVKEARAAYRQSVLEHKKIARAVDFEVRRLHNDLTSSIKELNSLEEATTAAQKSYDSLRKEYRLGLVTNLDVLQALDFLQTQKSALDNARFQTKLLLIQLHVATEAVQ